uniref:BCNT-C domain-containing protein n=1 Tax=Strongyloides stercoralis TaxID=6248 RepID=A0A0K0EPX4_STRER
DKNKNENEDKNKNENEDKNKKENENKNKNKNTKVNKSKNVKKNEKEPETIDNENSDDDLEKIILAEMELSSSSSSSSSEDEEEREKEESSTKPDIDFVEALLENKEDEKKMIVKTTRSSLPKKTNKSNRAQNKSDEFHEPLLSVEKVINKPKRATNTITGRKTKSVREQISDMDIAKIKEKYKLDMEKMKKNVEAIKMKK